jgi:hypothetical protein
MHLSYERPSLLSRFLDIISKHTPWRLITRLGCQLIYCLTCIEKRNSIKRKALRLSGEQLNIGATILFP